MTDGPKSLVDAIVDARRERSTASDLRQHCRGCFDHLLGTLFPQLGPAAPADRTAVEADLEKVRESFMFLATRLNAPIPAGEQFFHSLPSLRDELTDDAKAIFEGDPAAKSFEEVLLTYPGFFAIAAYRCAHRLHRAGVPLVPRLLTEYAHEKTGIDIHPGATIGRSFSIDHGTGVVIGETTVIGKNVKIFQGVTLGALTVTKDRANQKRHPTIEDNVVIYAGATILGGDTVVGRDSVIAGNAWLTQSVAPNSLVSRKSEVRPKTGDASDWLDFAI